MAFAKKRAGLTAHEKAQRKVKQARNKLMSAARDVNTALTHLDAATRSVEEAHVVLATSQAQGHVGREFSVGTQSSRAFLARFIFEAMTLKKIPTMKPYLGDASKLVAPIEAMEKNLLNLEQRDPAKEAGRLADEQQDWEIAQAGIAADLDNGAFVLSALSTVTADGTLAEDELPEAVQTWLKENEGKDISPAFIREIMVGRGFFDPNMV